MNLLLVDDDAAYAGALAGELGALNHRVTMVSTGSDALLAIERDGFDAIVLDRLLPDMDGLFVVERLRDRGRLLPILMLCVSGNSSDKVRGLTSGADDYVVKPTPVVEIDARLMALVRARGWSVSGIDTLRAGDIVVNPARLRAWRGGRSLDLAKLEFGLLSELVRNKGSVLTRATLIERVWGHDVGPAANIVDAQIRTLRRKLMVHGDGDPIVTRRGIGYMITD